MKDLKNLTDKLSDFGSCVSNQSSSSNEESEEDTTSNLNSKNLNEKRRRKRNKRKLKVTPVKEDFLKRPNLSTTNQLFSQNFSMIDIDLYRIRIGIFIPKESRLKKSYLMLYTSRKDNIFYKKNKPIFLVSWVVDHIAAVKY